MFVELYLIVQVIWIQFQEKKLKTLSKAHYSKSSVTIWQARRRNPFTWNHVSIARFQMFQKQSSNYLNNKTTTCSLKAKSWENPSPSLQKVPVFKRKWVTALWVCWCERWFHALQLNNMPIFIAFTWNKCFFGECLFY